MNFNIITTHNSMKQHSQKYIEYIDLVYIQNTDDEMGISHFRTKNYITANDDNFTSKIRYQALWRGIIERQLLDASGFVSHHNLSAKKHQKRAIKWLFTKNKDFLTVCDYADVSPQIVQNLAHYFIDENEI